MDFRMVGLDTLAGSEPCFGSSLSADPGTRQRLYGSGSLKQGRPDVDEWRGSKVSKTDDGFSASKAMLLRSNGSLLSDGGHQMLSFSSPTSQTLTLPYYSARNSGYGYGCGGMNGAGMHGVFSGVRGPFTPSQWMELENQALIYKYLTANMPVPSNLLIPIRKALDSAALSAFSAAPLGPSSWGWGAFRLGFPNTTDPEPGRCRRTDGKKWRCSRDAVADQKYCERHMNRGRNRSRKPVEGQSGHSVAGSTATAKVVPTATPSPAVPGGGSLSNHPQLKSLHPAPHINRGFMNKEDVGESGRIQDEPGLSMFSSTIGLNRDQFSIQKGDPFEESSRAEFGRVCSDSLLNPLQKRSSLVSCRNYSSSQDVHDRENESQHSVHQFMDDWPKNLGDRSAISWQGIDLQAERTQLSISIPVAASDFMSSTSSPVHEKLGLRLSSHLDSTQMGLGLGSGVNEPGQRQANWVPISWETSMGGPLGEVLNSTNSSAGDCKSSSALNLMAEASSPTGVLQKVAFRSLSNSSGGSSPRAHEGASSLCSDLLMTSSLVSSSSLPAL